MAKKKAAQSPFDRVNAIWSRFIGYEPAGGITIVVFAVLAMVLANSPLHELYEKFLHFHVALSFGPVHLDQSFQHFVNDALMAIFFLLVGLEIKREFVLGELSSFRRALLPFAAAAAGMGIPALIYAYFNLGTEAMNGWAIPAATDIAFAIGILAILGSRVPIALRVLLVAIAVIDDLGAILIIAFFYTDSFSLIGLWGAAGCVLALVILNLYGVGNTPVYVILGLTLWYFIFISGLHATIAGVILGMLIPIRDAKGKSPLTKWEHSIANWVAFLILPLFAFSNAGVSFLGLSADILFTPISLGIAAGLFVGKQVGIFSAIYLMIKSKLVPMPKNATWPQIYAIAMLCGIGFTISLFIGNLAFDGNAFDAPVRIGVLGGSILSAVFGYIIMRLATKPPEAKAKR